MTDLLWPSPASSRWATVNGSAIYYLEAGNGPPAILIHGMGGSANESSSLHILRRCGHVPQIERAEEFNRLAFEFLSHVLPMKKKTSRCQN